MSKVVFVGNVPYNMGEEQLIDVFKSVGQVVGFRLVYDRDTGKPRGYGFCEFADHDTAQSAVRNLNNVDVGGRPLRIDLADSDPFLEGKTTVRGELIDGGETRAQWRERERDGFREPRDKERDKDAFLRTLPPGMPLPPGAQVLDMISRTLATMNPGQLVEVLAQMKAFVITHPEQARALLVGHPQLSYALFQALLLNKIVDPAILERMLAATGSQPGASGHSAPPPAPMPPSFHAPQPQQPPFFQAPPPNVPQTHTPQHHMQAQPPQPMPPPPPSYFNPNAGPAGLMNSGPPPAPRPAPQGNNSGGGFEGLNIDPSQRAMLLQVLSLTPEQINQLPPTERDTIMNLRSQLGGLA